MSKNGYFLDDFKDWMEKRGKINRSSNRPMGGLSPRTATTRYKLVRRMLVDMGYLQQIKDGHAAEPDIYRVNNDKKLYEISLNEIRSWFDTNFDLRDASPQEKTREQAYLVAFRKFCEWLYFDYTFRSKPGWTEAKLQRFKEQFPLKKIKVPELDIIPPERVDPFIDYLKTKNRRYHIVAYLSRWLGGMRFTEVINAHADLKTGTLMVNFETRKITIYGKGDGGMGKPRHTLLTDHVEKELNEYIEWRDGQGLESIWLVPTASGDKFSDKRGSATYNNALARHAKSYGKFSKGDLTKIKSHSIGRHAYGTYYADKLPAKTLMRYMGIEKYEVVERYINFSKAKELAMLNKADSIHANRKTNSKRGGRPASPSSQPSVSPDEWAEFQEYRKFKAMMEAKKAAEGAGQ